MCHYNNTLYSMESNWISFYKLSLGSSGYNGLAYQMFPIMNIENRHK